MVSVSGALGSVGESGTPEKPQSFISGGKAVSEAGTKQGHRERGRNSDPTMPKASAEPGCAALYAWVPQRNVLAGACGAEKGHPQELKFPRTSQGQS